MESFGEAEHYDMTADDHDEDEVQASVPVLPSYRVRTKNTFIDVTYTDEMDNVSVGAASAPDLTATVPDSIAGLRCLALRRNCDWRDSRAAIRIQAGIRGFCARRSAARLRTMNRISRMLENIEANICKSDDVVQQKTNNG